jgi:beta-lactamase regulating signal transducer with metallopeptidase domain
MTTTTMALMALGGTTVLGIAAVATLLLSRASASLRHLVWTAALGALVAIPVFEASGMRVEVPVPGWLGGDRIATADAREEKTVAGSLEPNAGDLAPRSPVRAGVSADRPRASPSTHADSRAAAETGAETAAISSAAPRDRVDTSEGAPSSAGGAGAGLRAYAPTPDGSTSASEPSGASRWTPAGQEAVLQWPNPGGLAALSWALGALALLLAAAASHFAAYRLSTRGVERASPEASRRFAVLCLQLGLRRPVRLVASDAVDVPATWGLLRSTVVLPPSHETWSRETLDRVLLHELAHVRRGDCRAYLLGEVGRALHWPNPLAWLALARQREESERACDDLVLVHDEAPSRYAEDLVGLVRSLKTARALPAPLLTMAAESGFGRRVRAILDPDQARGGVGARVVVGAASAALALAALTTVVVPVASAQESSNEPPASPTAAEPVPNVEPVPDAPRSGELRAVPEPRAEPRPYVDATLPPFELRVPPLVEPRDPLPEPEAWEPRLREPSTWARGAALGAAMQRVGETLAPTGEAQELCVFRDGGRRSTSISSNDDEIRIRWETDDCRVEVDVEGEVVFLPDDTGVERMGRGALLEIEERIGRTERRARFEPGPGGVVRRFWVDGDEVSWSEEADRWIAAMLPELFRHTTINAEARVQRMLREGGADRVFAEVERMRSEHVASTYLELLMEHGSLDTQEYVRVIEIAGTLESDHNAGTLLMSVVDRAGLQSAFQDPLLRAAEGLGSDHQKSRVLERLLQADLTPAQLDAVVTSTRTIDSDHAASTVLASLARGQRLQVMDRAAFLDALDGIQSDHAKGTVVHAFLDAVSLDGDEVVRVLDMTRSIGSDHERATILVRVGREHRLTGAAATAYLRSAAGIESDHQLGQVARTLLEEGDTDQEQLELVLVLADDVESDHERASILQTVVERRDLSAFELRAVVDVARGIESDHQLASVLTRISEDERLDGEGVLLVLDAARSIGSDHQLASVMTTVARRYSIEGEAQSLYRDMADGMSRHQRDQVLAALVR